MVAHCLLLSPFHRTQKWSFIAAMMRVIHCAIETDDDDDDQDIPGLVMKMDGLAWEEWVIPGAETFVLAAPSCHLASLK